MPMGGNTSGAQCGDVKFWPTSSAPAGWLKANGALVSRTTYAALFAVIGTTYGAGDGATTFGLPDLRGEFVRGLDDGRGVDAARAVGSAQADAFKSHSHSYVRDGYNYFAAQAGATNVYAQFSGNFDSTASGGVETRPRNVAMLACIKY